MNLAASLSERPGVIVSTSSVIASRTFTTAPLPAWLSTETILCQLPRCPAVCQRTHCEHAQRRGTCEPSLIASRHAHSAPRFPPGGVHPHDRRGSCGHAQGPPRDRGL